MRVAGADVWKGRWIFVVLRDGRYDEAFVVPVFDGALERLVDVDVIGVDTPIGLPEPGRRRASDEEARRYVGPRRQSVFFAPSEDLLAAATAKEANVLAHSQGRAGVSAQTYGLKRAIAEVGTVASRDRRLHEVHPEVSFVAANCDRHLGWPKSSWNGTCLRRMILERRGISVPDDLGAAGVAGVDDVLDAAIVAWSADRIAQGTAIRMPDADDGVGPIWR